MTIVVNGAARDVDRGTVLGALVDAEVTARRGVAVAVDGEIVPRTEWDTLELHEDASVEIVAAVQGG